jgi:DNA gyrase subunit A
VVSIQVTERNGEVVSAALVGDDDEVMLISDGGILVRTRVAEISVLGRNTQGVRLIGLSNGEKLVGIASIAEEQDDEEEPAQ